MLTNHRSHPLRVAVLCSQAAPGLPDLLAYPDRTEAQVVGVLTSDPASSALPDTAGTGVPCLVHGIRDFYADAGAKLTDLSVRPIYDAGTAGMLASLQPDLLVLCGYLHVLTAPVLDLFPQRIVNIHDSDLSLLDEGGAPRYRGLRSTRDAVAAGEPETRSTIHIVTPEVDLGPLLLRSWSFPTHPMIHAANAWRAGGMLKAYAYAQRQWMMRAAWGLMLARAVQLFARDEVQVLDGRAVIAGVPGPITMEPPAQLARLMAPPPRTVRT